MSHKMLRPFIVKVSVLGYFPLLHATYYIPYYITICNSTTYYYKFLFWYSIII